MVGVVSDVRATTDGDPNSLDVYVPHAQDARSSMLLVTHTTADAASLAGPIRDAIWKVDVNQPIDAIQTMARAHYLSEASNFALLSLFVMFAIFALLMAAIGIYGVMAYSVSQRSKEIGLRMAVGAKGRDVLLQFLVEAVALSLVGGFVGVGLGFGLSQGLTEFLQWPTSVPPDAVVIAVGFAAATGIFFGFYPARKAARLDPIESLRFE